MSRTESNRNGGFSTDSTATTIGWRMKKATGTGFSGWDIMMTRPINGFCMDSLLNYSELQVTTNFSFLRGASHPEEMINQAAAYGYSAIAITDRNTFAGIVRGHVAAKKSKIKYIPA